MLIHCLLATTAGAVTAVTAGAVTADELVVDVVDYSQLKIFDAANGSYLRRSRAWGEFNQPSFIPGKKALLTLTEWGKFNQPSLITGKKSTLRAWGEFNQPSFIPG